MEHRNAADLARAFYAALAVGDRAQLDALLHPEFTGRTAEGMPFGIGGQHDGPAAMRRNAWGAIARHFDARAEPERFIDLADGGLLVTGRYRGQGKQGGVALDADFAHLMSIDQGRIRTLEQYTDTARWREAGGPLRAVLLDFADGVATFDQQSPVRIWIICTTRETASYSRHRDRFGRALLQSSQFGIQLHRQQGQALWR